MNGVVLVVLHRDLRLLRIAQRPMELVEFDDYGRLSTVHIIPKTAIVCDACNTMVATSEKEVEEEGLPVGYAVISHGYLSEVICQSCRNKYFSGSPAFNTLEDAGF